MFDNREPFQLVIISFILVTLMFDSGMILSGEIRCWSFLGNQRVDTYMLVGEKTNKDDTGGIGALSISSLEVALLLPLLSKPKRNKKKRK